MITISPYKTTWPTEFNQLGQQLRHHLGKLALAINHIGSTAVPDLAAKDIIDIQITVQALTRAVEQAINQAGYQRVERITRDHPPLGQPDQPDQWEKWIFKPPAEQRPVNVHVRMRGRANQRYALLFRDYLRAHPTTTHSYAEIKRVLAHHHPEDDMEVYYDVKDPVCDIIIEGAESWAASSGWDIPTTDA